VRRALRLLRHNIGLKLLSLALAVGAWGYVRFAGNLTLTAQLDHYLRPLTSCKP